MPAKIVLSVLKRKEKGIVCLICGAKAVKNGLHTGSDKQRYRCQSCQKSFIPNSRNFSTKESIDKIYEEFLNAGEPNIKSFAETHEYTKSTLYQHLDLAGINNIKYTKLLCRSVLIVILRNTDALIAKELRFDIHQGGVRLILDGQGIIDNEALFEFHKVQNHRNKYNCNKVTDGNLEQIVTGQPFDIADHLKRFELKWIVLSSEEFRMRKRKTKKVHK